MESDQYLEAAGRALDWCLEKQTGDGSLRMPEKCFDGIYKFPAAFEVMGKHLEAAKLLTWLETTALTDDGDLSLDGNKVLMDWHNNFYLYTNSWIALGAQRAGFFHLADRLMDYIVGYQNPVTGDFKSGPKGDASDLHDTTITANCAVACLFTGRIPVALKAADAIGNIVNQQDQPDVFYFRTDRQGHLVRKFPDEKKLWFRIDSREPGQLYWYLGIAAALLAHVYAIRGEKRNLQQAETIMAFLFRCHRDVLATFASGKVGYAAALLYRLTGDRQYREAAMTLMDWLVRVQKSDGRWTVDQPDLPWYLTWDCTAEFAYWLTEMVAILGANQRISSAAQSAKRSSPPMDSPLLSSETQRSDLVPGCKSRIRVRIEHVFGFMTQSMGGLYLRYIGKVRNTAAIGLINLIYNLARYEQIVRLDLMKTEPLKTG